MKNNLLLFRSIRFPKSNTYNPLLTKPPLIPANCHSFLQLPLIWHALGNIFTKQNASL